VPYGGVTARLATGRTLRNLRMPEFRYSFKQRVTCVYRLELTYEASRTTAASWMKELYIESLLVLNARSEIAWRVRDLALETRCCAMIRAVVNPCEVLYQLTSGAKRNLP
jgi:hypothetical protein